MHIPFLKVFARACDQPLTMIGVLLVALAVCAAAAPDSRAAELAHPFVGEFSPAGTPRGVAVDNSGDVYVLGDSGQDIQKFDTSGNPVAFASLGTNTISVGETEATAIAVDNSGAVADGDIYVAAGPAIQIYGSDGTKLGEINRGASRQFTSLQGVAVDASGRLYASDLSSPGGAPAIFRYVPSGNPPENADYSAQIHEEVPVFNPYSLAVDSEGSVYGLNELGEGGVVAKYEADRFGQRGVRRLVPLNEPARAIAVAPFTDALYAALTAEIEVVDSNGGSLGTFGSGHVDAPVGVAINKSGEVFVANSGSGSISIFGPGSEPPSVSLRSPSEVGPDAATLNGVVDPVGVSVISCRFEYGDTSSYGQSVPCSPNPGSSPDAVDVSAAISGLSPGATYHYRLTATNSNGTREGVDATFVTAGSPVNQACELSRPPLSSSLPDCRAYEQVSPVDKGHYDVANPPEGYASDVISPSGDQVAISSFVPLPGAASGSLISGIGASRGISGWNSFRIDAPYSTSVTGIYDATGGSIEFGSSADLTKLFIYSPEVLAPGGIQGNANYYYYDSSTDYYQLISTVPDNFFTYPALSTVFAGGAADGSSFVFRAFLVLNSTPPVPASLESEALTNGILYEWSPAGGLRLVGILPDGSVDLNGALPAGSFPGAYEYTVAVQQHVVSNDGNRIYWSEPGGDLYLREGAITKPVSRDASGVIQPAEFTYATPNGESAFITSSNRLTGDASTEGSDLYRYDAGSGTIEDLTPASQHSGSAEVVRVFGASDDGKYVYFQAKGALAEGATAGNPNIYVWHEGRTSFIGAVNDFIEPLSTLEVPASEIGTRWRVSPDGESFGFLTKARIAGPSPQRPRPAAQAYLYTYGNDSLTCVSCHEGYENGPVKFVAKNSSGLGGDVLRYQSQSAFSVTDGGRVFFSSPDALLPEDTNGKRDVYEYEGGSLHLISSGRATVDSELIGATPSGNDVFFTSSDRLVGQDTDNNVDVYDARVDGGLPSQNPAPPSGPCVGEGCRSTSSPQPGQIAPGSSSFVGPGNSAGRPKVQRCKSGKSKKAKCSKKHRRPPHHQKSSHRRKPSHSKARRSAR